MGLRYSAARERAEDREDWPEHFLAIDAWFNFFFVVLRQQGVDLLDAEGRIERSTPALAALWARVAEAALAGSLSIYNGYASEISRVGEIIASIGSTAGILYYGQEITRRDGVTEPVEYRIEPFPVLAGRRPLAIQRGGGFVVIRSDARHEEASVRFLKWFTEEARNHAFTRHSGYMPVKLSSYAETIEASAQEPDEAGPMASLMATLGDMAQRFDFTWVPPGPQPHTLMERFDDELREALRLAIESGEAPGPEADEATRQAYYAALLEAALDRVEAEP